MIDSKPNLGPEAAARVAFESACRLYWNAYTTFESACAAAGQRPQAELKAALDVCESALDDYWQTYDACKSALAQHTNNNKG